ncbi:GNAT family N-acetyltransferase [Paenibacillus sp. 2TAB19]|uniref:GNAT family N-acetyltransferase n=1 Tax=Paenibacillus sp. 2TAB19 TaxID=3233003 RepID=UPI003F99BA1D
MEVSLEMIGEDGLAALNKLVELAAYDLSELSGSDIHENGMFVMDFDSRNWFEDSNMDLYFIRYDGKITGFAVVRIIPEEEINYFNHFFVLRKYRNKKIGKDAAIKVFNRYLGKWRVSQFDWNLPAQQFWRKTLKEYIGDNYVETRRKDNKGPMQEFERETIK